MLYSIIILAQFYIICYNVDLPQNNYYHHSTEVPLSYLMSVNVGLVFFFYLLISIQKLQCSFNPYLLSMRD